MILRSLAGALLLAPSVLVAQVVAPVAPVSAPIAAPVMTNAVLRTGTEVPLRLVEELTTKGKKLRAGQRIHLETSAPVMVQGVNVIPTGSPAVAELTDIRNKGMWGKSGHLAGRVLYVTVNGRQIHLSGVFDDKGVAGGVGAVAAAAIVALPLGFFMTGTSAYLPAGAPVKGFVDEDVPLNFAAASMAPMAVAAPAPVAIPVAAVPTASLAPASASQGSLKK